MSVLGNTLLIDVIGTEINSPSLCIDSGAFFDIVVALWKGPFPTVVLTLSCFTTISSEEMRTVGFML